MEARDQLGYSNSVLRNGSGSEGGVNSRSGKMETCIYISQWILEVKSISFVD